MTASDVPPRLLQGMQACLIVDSDHIPKWQFDALEYAVEGGLRVNAVLMCRGGQPSRSLRHWAYYLLRVLQMNRRWESPVAWRSLVDAEVPVRIFEPSLDGQWQRIPSHVKAFLQSASPDVVIKFGMGLLRDPEHLAAPLGVLSYHHGDPSEFRGRPAGFYEVLKGADHMGTVVQRLNNRLDHGEVLAYGSSRVIAHSFAATLRNAYTNSSHLLLKALRNAASGTTVRKRTDGPLYRLPETTAVLQLIVSLGWRKMRRLVYGIAWQKDWRIGTISTVDVSLPPAAPVRIEQAFAAPPPYAFLADPIALTSDSVLCEAMRRNGKGLLTHLHLRTGALTPLDTSHLGRGHLSYPTVVNDGTTHYLLPEMERIGEQMLVPIDPVSLALGTPVPLRGLDGERLLDPTLVKHSGRWWLFAGRKGHNDLLFLWSADGIVGPYREHPDSPVVIDPARARPGGPIHLSNGTMVRYGQDNRHGYGSGITVCRITTITQNRYEEVPEYRVSLANVNGPHTYTDLGNGRAAVDYYIDVRSPLAWLRRIRQYL